MFTSRLNRLGFLLGFVYYFLPIIGLVVLFGLVTTIFAGGVSSEQQLFSNHPVQRTINAIIYLLAAVWVILALPVQFSLVVRRWHDLDQSGWLALIQILPFVSFITFLILVFAPGNPNPNKYGQPVHKKDFKTVLLGTE